MKATLQLYLHPSLPIPIPLFSPVDHGRLISICFTVISHSSSGAAALPAYWACLPRRQLSLSASRRRLAALALQHAPRFSGVFHQVHPNAGLCCCDSVSPDAVLLVAFFSTALCWFMPILFPVKCILHWCVELLLQIPVWTHTWAFEQASATNVNLTKYNETVNEVRNWWWWWKFTVHTAQWTRGQWELLFEQLPKPCLMWCVLCICVFHYCTKNLEPFEYFWNFAFNF